MFLFDFLFRYIAFLIKIEKHGQVVHGFFQCGVRIGPAFQQGNILQLFFSFLWIIPKACGMRLFFFFLNQ
jgi:hypothetical protein